MQSLEKLSARRREAELQIDAQTAELRGIERNLEQTRSEYHAASDAVHDAQQRLYEVNTEITRIEGEQRRLRELRDRTILAKEAASQIIEAETVAQQEGESKRITDSEAATMAELALAEKRAEAEQLRATLAPLEQALNSRNETLAAAQADAAVVQTELRALSDRQADLSGRIRRLEARVQEQDREQSAPGAACARNHRP